MESLFSVYFAMGRDHILTIEAYDHIAFLIAMCALYRFSEWKKILILVTAFTIGHSFTLAMAAYKVFTPNYDVVEKLIPITIILTAAWNIWKVNTDKSADSSPKRLLSLPNLGHYGAALVFGLVHGLAFSNQFIATEPAEAVTSLLAFNIGIEAGQLAIVAFILCCVFMVERLRLPQQIWTIGVSLVALGIGVYMLF
ncbi:MAG: hypothetical protein RL757_2775 [Bacteroidota bacterium]|jgi:ABC-type uncharacterized transport system permease subunit